MRKISHLWRKPTASEMLETMTENARAELDNAEMQLVLAKDALHTATATRKFHAERLAMLEAQLLGTAKVVPQPAQL